MNEISFADPWDFATSATPALVQAIRRRGNGWWVLVDGEWVNDRGWRRRDGILADFVDLLPDTGYWSKIKYKATRQHGLYQLWSYLAPQIMVATLELGWEPPRYQRPVTPAPPDS